LSFRDIVITKGEGLKNLAVKLANGTDTVNLNVPVVVIREDTTVPLKFFHNVLSERPVLINEVVRVRGVVSAVFGNKTYIQDTFRDTVAGLVLYGSIGVNPGELVIAEGEFEPYRGLEEISYGENVPIVDRYNNSGNLYLDRYGNVESFPPPDTIFDLVGVVDEDSGSAGNIYRIVPREPSDLIFYNSVMVLYQSPYFVHRGRASTWKFHLSSFNPVAKLRVCSDGITPSEMGGTKLGSRSPDDVITLADTTCAEFLNPAFTSDTLTLSLDPKDVDSITVLLYSALDTADIYRRSVFSPRLYFTTPISDIQAYGEDYSSNLLGQTVLVGGVVLADASAFRVQRTYRGTLLLG